MSLRLDCGEILLSWPGSARDRRLSPSRNNSHNWSTTALELQTKDHEDITITEKAPTWAKLQSCASISVRCILNNRKRHFRLWLLWLYMIYCDYCDLWLTILTWAVMTVSLITRYSPDKQTIVPLLPPPTQVATLLPPTQPPPSTGIHITQQSHDYYLQN